jgi:hypothetical protein
MVKIQVSKICIASPSQLPCSVIKLFFFFFFDIQQRMIEVETQAIFLSRLPIYSPGSISMQQPQKILVLAAVFASSASFGLHPPVIAYAQTAMNNYKITTLAYCHPYVSSGNISN